MTRMRSLVRLQYLPPLPRHSPDFSAKQGNGGKLTVRVRPRWQTVSRSVVIFPLFRNGPNRVPNPTSCLKQEVLYGYDADRPVRVSRKGRQEDSSWVFVPRKRIPIHVSTLKPMVSDHRFIHNCPETENQLSTGSFLQSIHLFQKIFQYRHCMPYCLTLYAKEIKQK